MSLLEKFIISSEIYISGAIALIAIFNFIFGVRFSNKKILVFSFTYIFSGYIGFFIEKYYYDSANAMLLKNMISFIAIFLVARYFLKLRYGIIFLTVVIHLFLTAIGQIIALSLFSIFGINVELVKTNFSLYFLAYTIDCIFVFITIHFVYLLKMNKIVMFSAQISKNIFVRLILNLLIVALILVANSYLLTSASKILWSSKLITVNLVLVIIPFIFLLVQINLYSRLEKTSMELRDQVLFNEVMTSYLDEIKRIKHNYNNTINTLNGYTYAKNWDGLEKYLGEIVNEATSINSMNNLISLKISNAPLVGLIGTKLQMATEKKVYFNVCVKNEVGREYVEMYSLCDILGCLIDNAIEAAEISPKKTISLGIDKVGDSFVFKVENSFKEKPDINRIFQRGVSTKGDGRGNGLWYVTSRLARQKDMMLNTFIKDNTFIQELIVEKSR